MPRKASFPIGDWETDDVRALGAERAAWLDLLVAAWHDATGTVPADERRLAVLSGLGERWDQSELRKRLATWFQPDPHEAGRLVCLPIRDELDRRRAWSEKSRRGGIASGAARRAKAARSLAGEQACPASRIEPCFANHGSTVPPGVNHPLNHPSNHPSPAPNHPSPGPKLASLPPADDDPIGHPSAPSAESSGEIAVRQPDVNHGSNGPTQADSPPHPLCDGDIPKNTSGGGGGVDLFNQPRRDRIRMTAADKSRCVELVHFVQQTIGSEHALRSSLAIRNAYKLLTQGCSTEDIERAAMAYGALCSRRRRPPRYRQATHTFLHFETIQEYLKPYAKRTEEERARAQAKRTRRQEDDGPRLASDEIRRRLADAMAQQQINPGRSPNLRGDCNATSSPSTRGAAMP